MELQSCPLLYVEYFDQINIFEKHLWYAVLQSFFFNFYWNVLYHCINIPKYIFFILLKNFTFKSGALLKKAVVHILILIFRPICIFFS